LPPPSDLSTLSLHDALPILCRADQANQVFELAVVQGQAYAVDRYAEARAARRDAHIAQRRDLEPSAHAGALDARHRGMARELQRSEEHTSELQSRENLVCRL